MQCMARGSNNKSGKITIPADVFPEKHELVTTNFFAHLGKNVEFLAPNNHISTKTADIKVDGLIWEMKAPKAASKRTIENALRAALRQSSNIIFDLQRTKMHQDKCVAELTRQFELSKKIKRLIIIKKSRQSITL